MGMEKSIGDRVGTLDGHSAALRAAHDVVDHLAADKEVSSDEVDAARDAMFDRVRTGTTPLDRHTSDGLATLFQKSTDRTGRAHLLGELIAAGGPRAQAPLDAIIERGSTQLFEFLSHQEIKSLRNLLELPLGQRLEVITAWLAREFEQHPSDHKSPRPPGRQPVPTNEAILPRRLEEAEDEPENGDKSPDGFDRPPDQILQNASLPEEQRADAVSHLGATAVPALLDLAKDPSQQEFVATQFVKLGRMPEALKAAREAAARMKFDPDLKPIGEYVSRAIEGETVSKPTESPSKQIGDGWLRRALDQCSAPSILGTAAGREGIVIPLVLRRLTELRDLRSFVTKAS